jgi:hypothetical protein
VTDKHYYVEKDSGGKFAVRAKGSLRAIRLLSTQAEAEGVAKKFNSKDKPNVDRIRNVKTGTRDKWRKG